MIELKLATLADANDYANIINKSWKDTYGEYVAFEHIDDEFNIENLVSGFEKYISDSSFELYMIVSDGIICGILEIGGPGDPYKEDMAGYGEIRSLHIKKEYHHKGIGKYVMNFALNRLKGLGYSRFYLWCKKQNTNALAFYKLFGFKETKYGCEHTVDGAPSLVMEKN